ncbi:hypothetical protein JCM3774_002121 [Rhodotorula dairenensis]
MENGGSRAPIRLGGKEREGEQGRGPASFEMLVLGCGGGPVGSNLSSYLVKSRARKWSEGCSGLEGGSTLGAIVALAERAPDLFSGMGLEHELDVRAAARRTRARRNDTGAGGREAVAGERTESERQRKARAFRTGGVVWDSINCFLITHGHLDHVAGLVISSALCRPELKPVYGVEHTIANLERAMDGGVWPVLGAREGGKVKAVAYEYRVVEAPSIRPRALSPSLSFTAFPVAHGPDPSTSSCTTSPASSPRPSDPAAPLPSDAAEHDSILAQAKEVYCSTAVFIKEDESEREFLFFGDVEPDSVSGTDLNRKVWTAAAQKIADRKLDTLFIECSYPSSQPRELLFGHLSPPFLMEELDVLAELVRTRRGSTATAAGLTGPDRPLEGVKVVIIHIKDELYPPPPPAVPRPRPSSIAPADPATDASLDVAKPVSDSRLRRRSPRLESNRLSAPVLSPAGVPTTVGKSVEDEDEDEEEDEEEAEAETVQERIERELNELERVRRTGVEFVLARQGMRIGTSSF